MQYNRSNTIEEFFSQLRQYFQKNNITRKEVSDKPPLRSELFSTEQMEQHAMYLAGTHQLSFESAPEQLLKNLDENEEVLLRVTHLLQNAVKEKSRVTPAGEWLLDNFYLIEEQIRLGKRHLPKGYSKGLPRLTHGAFAGYPRVYDIAVEIISHSDGHVDIQSLTHFISSYQKVSELTIGELWAIPIMLRLALLENLSRVAAQIAIDRIDSAQANHWAKRIIETAENNKKDLVLVIADMARSNPPMVSAFVAEFSRKLQWKGPDLSLPLTWIEQHLSDQGTTINAMVLDENQKQAADQLSMSNSINSLRFLAKMDWREFVETMSVVEQTLRQDVNGVYTRMDFLTRDSYRHAVEKIAKNSKLSENEVAQRALYLATDSARENPTDQRKAHVGYYLIDAGVRRTEHFCSVKHSFIKTIAKKIYNYKYSVYVIASLLLTLLMVFALTEKASSDGVNNFWLIIVGILSLFAGSHFALAIVNWVATLCVKPRSLPRMDFSEGVPSESRTLVIVPTLITGQQQIEKLIEAMEIRFLANRDSNLVFGLLTDFTDAKEQFVTGDDILVNTLKNGVEDLNRRYGYQSNEMFFLFHRPRLWNESEKTWMGYERKRGKLSDLNHLIRGGLKDPFTVIVGDEKIYTSIKYVITLDTDTQLPRDAGWKLAGIMSHPLNRAVYDEKKNIVVDGYGIIQPRIAISLHGATRSHYSRLHESDTGIDPYTRVVSDVYQDIFNEGSFIGKGIYEVDVFEKVLNNRFPDNRILSHDLLEGSYTRCGYASDVQFYEDFPSRYSADVSRRHRWIRGDWQIANWFLPFAPGRGNKWQRNPISVLSKWKILDNLRRSVMPFVFIAFFLLGWLVFPSAWFWTLAITAIILIPSLLVSGWNLIQKPDEVTISHHLSNATRATYKSALQALFTLITLPYEAFVSLDAIIRTQWRMAITKKHLLQWTPSNFIQSKPHENLVDVFRAMMVAPLISIGITGWLIFFSPFTLLFASPLLVAWFISPALVWWMGKPIPSSKSKLSNTQKVYLRELSRKTWAFFENLVTAADQWLPPDNLQQYPIPVIAHRTSPTNIGMSLLSNLAAHDFGYVTTTQFIDRCTQTLNTMSKMERYNGHFFNWYDTQSLKTLHPKYISTVDSGNLAGHLLTLRQGLLGLRDGKIIDTQIIDGIHDTLRIIDQKIAVSQSPLLDQFKEKLVALKEPDLFNPLYLREKFEALANEFTSLTKTWSLDPKSDGDFWVKSAESQFKAALREINTWSFKENLAPVPDKFRNLPLLTAFSSLSKLSLPVVDFAKEMKDYDPGENTAEENRWLEKLQTSLKELGNRAKEKILTLEYMSAQCYEFADLQYDFLYDKGQHLLAIGYNVDDHRRDASFYDLLASEARLSSFVAIAQGKLPQDNWFALGRRLTSAMSTPVLLSWSGSMFEYLMPTLVMPSYENTLLEETEKGTIKKQIEYARQHTVPWGISESCYNVVDAHLTYQYKAFGIPGLGFKRGLSEDLVIAPYASVMGLMVDPEASCNNLEKMNSLGFEGKYGFYEAVDYTPSRLPRGRNHVVIQSFMAHHQGMSLLSLAYLLLDQPMQKRFEADPQFQTALLLLQEQVPKTTGYYTAATEMSDIAPVVPHADMRVIATADTPIPEVQLLSNGRYHVMVTNAGGGYSRWKETAVTRWREDTTSDHWGSFCYLRDLDSGELWSTAHHPTLREAAHYSAVFSQGRAEFRRRDNYIETHTEIIVSPEDDIEIRRVNLINRSKAKRRLELTSYAEVVLASPMADAAHPAFSNLFVQTEILSSQHALLCTRRPRSHDEAPPWMFHLMKVNGLDSDSFSFETDRDKFIGRRNTVVHPKALSRKEPLSNSQGSVLDPIVSIQHRITLGPEETITIDIITGISASREGSKSLIDKYQDRHLRDRAFELSWTHSQVVLRQINANESDAQLYGRLASSVIYTNPSLRADPTLLIKNQRGQSALWAYSISGDLPIVLLLVSDTSNITIVRQLIQARAYWQLKGLATDLVILNEDHSGYRQVLQEQIQSMVAANVGSSTLERQGGIFVRSADQVSNEDRILLQTLARIIISDSRGTLLDQINKRMPVKAAMPYLIPSQSYPLIADQSSPYTDLIFNNEIGGFATSGKEYIITTDKEKVNPLPWINVIANKNFGMIVSESGSSYTWAGNAHEFRLTPWNNDPVSDGCGEAYYIRDEKSGMYWSPVPWPASGKAPYCVRHGFGYSLFEHTEDGIKTETTIYADAEEPIKFVSIKIRNQSGRARKLSATGYVEWILGSIRSKSVMHIVTDLDPGIGSLIARNPYNTEFAGHIAFYDVDELNYTFTCDRTEFLGRNNNLSNPDAMKRQRLSGRFGAGLDSCAAIQIAFDLEHGMEREVIFRMGAGKEMTEVNRMVKKFKGSTAAKNALAKVREQWENVLNAVRIETPDQSLNLLTNGWLLYQVMSCRLWGRSGFYQSGGAFGFRDQLQDTLALLHVQPELTREQILLAASRQFKEGDVQHWWHPPLGRGVRTQCSDDFLWLPFVTSRYVESTGDTEIIKEQVPFIEGRMLNLHEESYYDLPIRSEQLVTLYEHCKRAINQGLRLGPHGIPLIGSGDWNDGMNMVGIQGKGESIWLGFFLYDTLRRFIKVAAIMNDTSFAKKCEDEMKALSNNINKYAWDGNWYLRAWFDDGTPLGSSHNMECKIDSISQSWSVLSGAGEEDRSFTAMQSVNKYLVNRDKALLQLLDPPFDKSETDPGYIKGYVPGVRENGGQYTHAAIWMVMAFAKLGDTQRVWELLNMINPINHGRTADEVKIYKAEPYVMAADVYGVDPHTGRGGWTWYTGSAGWMYQLVVESFLGLKREGDLLGFEPCVPEDWKSFKIDYRFKDTNYHIILNQNSETEDVEISVDGNKQTDKLLKLVDDQRDHEVIVHFHFAARLEMAEEGRKSIPSF
jgi:cyclic beta-1,2-glucan synthetase